MRKGLSSSAAVCVLVVKCFNETYGLGMTQAGTTTTHILLLMNSTIHTSTHLVTADQYTHQHTLLPSPTSTSYQHTVLTHPIY